jgi:hypothetical protein
MQIPKVQKIQSCCRSFIVLLGFMRVKAARKMLVKLTTGENGHALLREDGDEPEVLLSGLQPTLQLSRTILDKLRPSSFNVVEKRVVYMFRCLVKIKCKKKHKNVPLLYPPFKD